ncbi:indolepyruvate ferredoxin oxidoreductase beta subunit [Dethiosulfatibacter aminovorans DSM 17477]|uniref:Indolepyruvate ferredoxin oxidoreductase beta subunit n=1 Tax=Dethiosulfatibacter aminovorans DSM 17477 TaxID=1121476 RepID=A0A1M6GRT5_9FIRM|nr:indolepyruvate oxidoreductase subunit beta [Dethiosulfatibacter aminovorans]SHJ12619.1 indolepyruvate ferredoxin oxidoreductase beta subunit [Dethiosulfatibacter aminovorans DSM 17477]
MSETKNILLVGVGGQGTILTSKIISNGFIDAGYEVKMAEIHGMSQRGGSVTTQIRYGEKVYSPVIEKGTADLIVAFEKSEALRWLEYLRKDGILIVNDYTIEPFTVSLGISGYPEEVIDEYKKKIKNIHVFNAFDMAKKIGNSKVMNIVLLGSMVKALSIDEIDWKEIIARTVPEKYVKLNQEAFEAGYND